MATPMAQLAATTQTNAALRIQQDRLTQQAAAQLRQAAATIRKLQEEVSYWKGMCEKARIIMTQQQTINEERVNHAQYESRSNGNPSAEHEPDRRDGGAAPDDAGRDHPEADGRGCAEAL